MALFSKSLLVLSLFVMGGMIFKSTAPTTCSTILEKDNIFVLTGDARRIPFAIKILNNKPNVNLYIIGAGANIKNLPKKVIVESKSKTTYQNAIAIKNIAIKNGLNRIVLITSADHFNRAKYLVRNELNDIEIAHCPVPLSNMTIEKQLERWLTEYLKYIGTLFGMRESIER